MGCSVAGGPRASGSDSFPGPPPARLRVFWRDCNRGSAALRPNRGSIERRGVMQSLKKLIVALGIGINLPAVAFAQTLNGNNTWTGTNTWNGASIWNGDGFFASGKPWADVMAYGAVADGSTDASAAVQAAINAVSSGLGGGIIYFPK